MTVITGFFQCVQVPQPCRRPELTDALAPALPRSASRLHGTAANRPAAPRQRPNLSQDFLFLPMPQPVQACFDPRPARRFVLGMQRLAQTPEVLAGVVEVQHLGRPAPPVLRHVPRAITGHQSGAGATPSTA